jgi:metal-sulfur cluster biosynthetic enzyme
LRRALVVVQVALSMVLIVGALLFGRSLRNLVTVDPGFRQDGVVAVSVDLRRSSIDPAALRQVQNQAMERVRTLPGVDSATVELVWHEPWSPERLSDTARAKLRFLPDPATVADPAAYAANLTKELP